MENLEWIRCWRIFLEAIFSHSRKFFAMYVLSLKFRHHFT